MKSVDIRENFLKFFEARGHTRVGSSSLIPAADPTLLFTNAGMNQFKDCFLGLSDFGYRRATTSQKCVRAGGKHNDLENVGFTPRHHTFFEMLGNFSFGDYFKKDAIAYAWELLTKVYGLPKDRLRVTVFETDDEAAAIWEAQGVPKNWITRLGEKDNFWAMGDTGPCGPCTEIYYDWGPSPGCDGPDAAPGAPGCDGRFLEIWNLVFMQYNRDTSGKLNPLPKPSVDTGSGLERMACVLQGVKSNYDTDLFAPLLKAIGSQVGKNYGTNAEFDTSMRVIADHMRSGTFLISDGVVPSNEGRGYVLRRILRRAIRHGKKLGQETPFLYRLVAAVEESLGQAYPELKKTRGLVETLLKEEETRFHETLHRGMGLLEDSLAKVAHGKKTTLPAETAFKLYDTFGFPLDLIEVICQERSVGVDTAGFEALMEKQRSLSVWKGSTSSVFLEKITQSLEKRPVQVTFQGYESLTASSRVLRLFDETGNEVATLADGKAGFAVLDKTPFYAESGGQVGDKGSLSWKGGTAEVHATEKIAKVIVHHITVGAGQPLAETTTCDAAVHAHLRRLTANNHTATHLLHAALRNHLGDRVKQAGSLVEPTKLRFDFTFPRAVSEEELLKIEAEINSVVSAGGSVSTKEMPYKDAIASGAMAFFDEKYGDEVRVISVAGFPGEKPYSVELCGGTHLTTTASIGLFKILSESSVASGVRRIEAATSESALAHLLGRDILLKEIERRLVVKDDAVLRKVEQLSSDLKFLQKQNDDLKVKLAQSGAKGGAAGGALHDKAKNIGPYRVVTETISGVDGKILRTLVDGVRDKLAANTVVLLGTAAEGKVTLCLGITKDLVGKLDSGKLIREIAPAVGGTGGGKPDFAQAGGSNADGIPEAFQKLEKLLATT